MALPDLATTADLTARGMDATDADAFLASASAAIRDAAGVPITRGTFTVKLTGFPDRPLRLPAQPIVSVDSVEIDGTAVTDWKLVSGRLWRRCGWARCHDEPSTITVTQTCGLTEVPADIVDLACSLVGLARKMAASGEYASRGDLVGVRIDDYGENYSQAIRQLAGPLELPDGTRARLRARFGGGATVIRAW